MKIDSVRGGAAKQIKCRNDIYKIHTEKTKC